ncbi:DivIVA domain-containing protein [Nanchangia anserum]|uniref:DivIVA domain-containing protein n=1 Tax=Nanchangia anserum TaxID=2692125 RepID=A0A8I0G6Z8_9ACTO|nr:DivIVA domain-containing protein [Nanchangia anserum]MBD3688980.1 DivIVA domain-containing protein [Nanchangia anserum]QOX81232.1 DivIVA domain-containing protein [Nanchangia anserum]
MSATRSFSSAGRFTRGYDPAEVDEFFQAARAAYEREPGAEPLRAADVRRAAFHQVRGGYVTQEVDLALDRLETAFVRQERAENVAAKGQNDWLAMVADRATTLYGRLIRPRGKRFRQANGRGYRISEVDDFLDRLSTFFEDGGEMTADEVRYQTFSSARGKDAYDEGVVDAFLARAIEVLTAVE